MSILLFENEAKTEDILELFSLFKLIVNNKILLIACVSYLAIKHTESNFPKALHKTL